MFFNLSKIFWFVADPGNILLFIICLTAFLAWIKWYKTVKYLITICALFAILLTTFPIGKMVINHLENRFQVVTVLPKNITGIIVLGGVVDQYLTNNREQIVINGAAERVTEFARLSKLYPKAKLIYTGGSGILGKQDLKEADFVSPLLKRFNIDQKRILFENQSRNTAENASFTSKIIKPTIKQRWIIITSAFHMPRAIGSFRRHNWNVLAYPVDFRTAVQIEYKLELNFISSLSSFSLAIHEMIGLIFYRLSGYTNELYPKPEM